VEHGKVATRHWQGRIRGDGLCEEIEGLLEITALGLLSGLIRQPLSLTYFFCSRLTIFDTGCAIGDRDADISSQKRKLLDDFFPQLGLRASTREVFRGKKSESDNLMIIACMEQNLAI
jgi:hypothetical protein